MSWPGEYLKDSSLGVWRTPKVLVWTSKGNYNPAVSVTHEERELPLAAIWKCTSTSSAHLRAGMTRHPNHNHTLPFQKKPPSGLLYHKSNCIKTQVRRQADIFEFSMMVKLALLAIHFVGHTLPLTNSTTPRKLPWSLTQLHKSDLSFEPSILILSAPISTLFSYLWSLPMSKTWN